MVKPTAPFARVHKTWCVRGDHTGACSEKRGHWDRSTNTWDSDLTVEDRRVMAEALRMWRVDGATIQEAGEWLRTHPTFSETPNGALLTWNMTQKKHAKNGIVWPSTQ